ncbi:DUF2316 family protein [Fructobacillus ficulneus]|uniref:Uncharacterized protein n=1 Tax=Fructobacillus ficulneus TaxID=157463 RepID=A0A0K8MIP9_9LACO|nr:DUF2316 family protein [Fructobacillus ficulneus]GAP00333.1 hypothetical protein FFIC_283500 [Fructobacillus ficulneus]
MSLTASQKVQTIRELQANFALLDLPLSTVAADLKTTTDHLEAVLNLEVAFIEEPWILKEYLARQLKERDIQPVPYTALVGNPADYWFLNQK